MNQFDVIIIGAGPAGCAAAISCAQHGLDVCLLEQACFPRERPGETLPPGIESLLQQLGVADTVLKGDFIRHTGHRVHWGEMQHFTAFGGEDTSPWRGFQISRATLDNLLLQRARALGVQIIQPCHASKVAMQGHRVAGIKTNAGDFFSKQLVDASGAHAWLARQLKLEYPVFSHQLIAKYGYVKGQVIECDEALGIFADLQGWYWTAKVSQDVYHWTRLSFAAEEAARAKPPLSFRHLEVLGATRGADVTWRMCKQTAGPGYFIAGDAAAVLDPSSSHGVLKALMSGMMAAHAIIQGAACSQRHNTIEVAYREWMKNGFMHDMKKLCELYRYHPSPPGWLPNG
jgi:flavin-dependent dehydrogenase